MSPLPMFANSRGVGVSGMPMPHGMCYFHFGIEICLFVTGQFPYKQQGFINDCYKVNPVGQWGKILVMAMGFVDHLGPSTVCF